MPTVPTHLMVDGEVQHLWNHRATARDWFFQSGARGGLWVTVKGSPGYRWCKTAAEPPHWLTAHHSGRRVLLYEDLRVLLYEYLRVLLHTYFGVLLYTHSAVLLTLRVLMSRTYSTTTGDIITLQSLRLINPCLQGLSFEPMSCHQIFLSAGWSLGDMG